MYEIGRVCMKTAGREAGKYCVIVKKEDENFVMVTGPKSVTKVNRRRCNINHLEPLMEKVNIKSDASDADVLKAYQEASVFSKLGIEKVSGTKSHGHEKKERHERTVHEKKDHKKGHGEKGEHKAHHHDHEKSKEHEHHKHETKPKDKKTKHEKGHKPRTKKTTKKARKK